MVQAKRTAKQMDHPDKKKGEGRKRKVFAESFGDKVDRAKGKAEWEKSKRVQKIGVPKAESTDGQRSAAKKISKSSIRANLLAKQREKTKRRKEARKAASSIAVPTGTETIPSSAIHHKNTIGVDKPKPKKRVSFA